MRVQHVVLALVGRLVLLSTDESRASQPQFGESRNTVDEGGAVLAEADVSTISVPSAGHSGMRTSSPYVWIGVPRYSSSGDLDNGNNGHCTRREWARVLREDAVAIEAQAQRDYVASYESLGLDREGFSPNVACPVDPADELPVAMVEEFVTAAVREQLPRPTLSLPPGYAITGMRTFLVTEHQLEFGPAETDVDLGIVAFNVVFSATGQSVVDWGDGTVTSHATGGAGFPDGRITHVYVDEQLVDITVTDTWTVDYEAGPFVGTLAAPLEPVTLPAVEIQQRQAVRTH